MGLRFPFAFKYASIHFLLSLCVAGLCALVVFFLWYPYPFYTFSGGVTLYLMVVGIDVVCGPLLTLILANPRKPKKERLLDFSLIGAIQIAALAYGLWTTYEARPVALVFEIDRFVAVRASALMPGDLAQARPEYRVLSPFAHYVVAAREPENNQEREESFTLSLSGFEPSQRPSLWVAIDDTQKMRIRRAAVPAAQFIDWYPQKDKMIRTILAKHGLSPDTAYFLPLTSGIMLDPLNEVVWSVLMDEDMVIRDYVPLDGFADR